MNYTQYAYFTGDRHVPTISIILLTHATISHIGAYAHCCKHFPLFTRIPTYATNPVISLGRTLLQDLYASSPTAASAIPKSDISETFYSLSLNKDDFSNILYEPPTSDEIARYFSLVHPLKYSQSHEPSSSPFSPSFNDLSITAYSAGHSLGGTIWHIQHGVESVVYAVDWNQAREHVFPGAAWLSGGAGIGSAEIMEALKRPTALVCSSKSALKVASSGGLKKRDESLLKIINDTVSAGGNVLVASDTSARALELAYTLESAWQEAHQNVSVDSPLRKANLCFASRTCGATMRYARSMLEWMEEGIVREFELAGSSKSNRAEHQQGGQPGFKVSGEDQRRNKMPFDLIHLRLVERKQQLLRLLAAEKPCVVLSSDSTLEWGLSREVLRNMADNEKDTVVFTERVGDSQKSTKTIGRRLWELIDEQERNSEDVSNNGASLTLRLAGQELPFEIASIKALEKDELTLYQQYLARRQQSRNILQPDEGIVLETSADAVDDQSSTSSSSEESDIDMQGKAMNISTMLSHSKHKVGVSDVELGINVLLRRNGIYDYHVRAKKGREKMFPFVAKRRRGDDFGDLIRPEDYLRAEERDDADGMDSRSAPSSAGDVLGRKRKWGDLNPGKKQGGRKLRNGVHKRPKNDELGSDHYLKNNIGDTATRLVDDENDLVDSDDEFEDVAHNGPSKVVSTIENIKLKLRVAFVNFSGLHDRRSLQMLIPMIKPRKLILTGGEEDETLSLAEDCRKLFNSESGKESGSNISIYTPVIGSTVDASVDTSAWVVKISHELYKKLHWQHVRNLGVVTLTGQLKAAASSNEAVEAAQRKKLKLSQKEENLVNAQARPLESQKADKSQVPLLDVVSSYGSLTRRLQAQSLHVGDLRLADLRRLMQASGRTAEFRGEGTLLIDEAVAVRKSGTGQIEVESAGVGFPGHRVANSAFFDVKRKVYEGLALVAGG